MSSMDGRETRFSFIGFLLAAIFGLVLPIYYIVKHVETKTGKHQVSVGPDALLLGGAVLLFAVVGFIVLWKRRRTMVAFLLFLVGLGVGYSILFIGFVFIVLGGWLMLNAWRIHRYGTADAKLIRQEAANRPRGREARAAAPRSKAAGTSSSGSGTRQGSHGEQALYAEGPASKEDPKAHAVTGLRSAGRIAGSQWSGSTRSAERSNCRTSARRRTSERAVGSSPSARSTSTSVTIPMTVE